MRQKITIKIEAGRIKAVLWLGCWAVAQAEDASINAVFAKLREAIL